jgi:AAA15 family ATPase/GTPase
MTTTHLNLTFVDPHRSIKNFKTVGLPNLTDISGPNGSGKTQLLQAIEAGKIIASNNTGKTLTAKIFDSSPVLSASFITFQILQDIQNVATDTIGLIDDLEESLSKSLETLILQKSSWVDLNRKSLLENFISGITKGTNLQFHSGQNEHYTGLIHSKPDHNLQRRNRWESFKKFVPLNALHSLSEFNGSKLKEGIYGFIQYQTFMNIDISLIFYSYFQEMQNNAYRKATGQSYIDEDGFAKKFGIPPWDEVNNLLKKYGFNHKFSGPDANTDPRATNGFKATVFDNNNDVIEVSELSSGEKVIIALLLSAYAAQQKVNKIFDVEIPELILFDELDAHLHPSMTRMMFDVIENSLIDKLSATILMTTHSPSNITIAPEQSIYQLTPGSNHELKKVDKATAARDLSDGFIQILDGSQIVIVEGKDDPLFYRAVERAVRTNGDLLGVPTLHFIPASKSTDPSTGGGAVAAEDWANKLNDAQLPNVHALLDNDGKRSPNGTIKVLGGRYAIENYVLDHLSLAVALITDGKLSVVDPNLPSKFPQVSSLKTASQSDLQELVDKISDFLEKHDSSLTSAKKTQVHYNKIGALDLPEWIATKRGKDLVKIVREAFMKHDRKYIITRKDFGDYDMDLGYLLKLWSQHPDLFPIELQQTLASFKPV